MEWMFMEATSQDASDAFCSLVATGEDPTLLSDGLPTRPQRGLEASWWQSSAVLTAASAVMTMALSDGTQVCSLSFPELSDGNPTRLL